MPFNRPLCVKRLATVCLSLIFVFCMLVSPLFTLIYQWTGLPLYRILTLVFFVSGLVNGDMFSRAVTDFLRVKINWLFLLFIGLLFLKSEGTDFPKILGAIVLPWISGTLIAKKSDDTNCSQEIRLFGGILALQCIALTVFIPNMFVAFPRRPELDGVAIYLLFGNFLPIVPVLVIFWGERLFGRYGMKKTILLATVISLFYVALLLVGINSRSLLFFSVLITVLHTALFVKSRIFKSIGLVIFPLALLVMAAILPGRVEHLTALLSDSSVDASMGLRISSNLSLLRTACNILIGCPSNMQSDVFKSSHFWFAQLYYILGAPGLVIFSVLFCAVLKSSVRLIVNAAREHKPSDLYIGLASLMCFASPVYSNSFINTPAFFAMAGLIVNSRPQRFRSLSLETKITPPHAGVV